MACGFSRWAFEDATNPYRSLPRAWARTQSFALSRLRVTAKPGFDKLEILENKIGFGFLRREDGVRVEQVFFRDHIDLRRGFFIGFDQFIGLIEAGVFEVVFAEFDLGDAEQGDFHDG